jgi:hypothetical protein
VPAILQKEDLWPRTASLCPGARSRHGQGLGWTRTSSTIDSCPPGGRQMGVQPLAQLFPSDGSDQPVDLGAVAEQDQ